MIKLCDAEYCYYSKPRQLGPSEKAKITQVPCQGCFKKSYCSQRCQQLDWNKGHQRECKEVPNGKLQRCRSADDTQSQASQMWKRTPDEFEFVSKNGSETLGQGSYGQVKLAVDKKTGKMYAIKIVILIY